MRSDELRAAFLDFFRQREHVIERSDTIVPSNDPTLLFTSAGMVQFKPYYTGEVPVPYRRAATSQKCLRAGGKANDLDEVGKTARHLTFFEMLGNFSFGDYFKREAIQWGWEFSTQVLKFPEDKIWISVFENDDETWDIWEKEMGISPSRLIRMGAKDNFWGPAGDTGACGPCSELLFDRGEHLGPNATPADDPGARFMEFWNLVFPQFDQQPDGSRPQLKNRGIDTGMGLERISALLQDVETVFDTDGIFPIIESTMSLCNVKYADNPVPFRVIADHARAVSFMIADGILPGNEGRGYVLRRLLRRAARFGRELGFERPFLHKVSQTVVDLMSHQYPELNEGRAHIDKIVHTEEERFASTLARGMDLLEGVFEQLDKEGRKQVPGEELFKLYDTYGFPMDLTRDIAEDRGYALDEEGFEAAMTRQRTQARSAWAGSGQASEDMSLRAIVSDLPETNFVGYDILAADAKCLCLTAVTGSFGQHYSRKVGATGQVHADKAEILSRASFELFAEGETGEVVLDRTPFYAESGGQVSDGGWLEWTGGLARVLAVKKLDKRFVHTIKVEQGTLKQGDTVHARVNDESRRSTENHHSATHILQSALQQVLGQHVHQAGSLVAPDRLRFDFTHFEGIDADRLHDIERLVNDFIRRDVEVCIKSMPLDEARKAGAMALFGEKYEDVVRVVSMGDFSMELCGGTHVPRTGVIGFCKIVSEGAVSAGVRRIEAVCGEAGVEAVQQREQQLHRAAKLLSASGENLEDRVRALMEENKRLQREVDKWKQAAATGASVDYISSAMNINGIKVVAAEVPGQDGKGLRMLLDNLRDKLGSGVIVLGAAEGGKAALCVGVTKDLTDKIKAGDIVSRIAPIIGGSGGGRPDMAQAGGKDADKLAEAIAKAPAVVGELL